MIFQGDTEIGGGGDFFQNGRKHREKTLIEALVRDVVMLQHGGDKAAVDAFLSTYAVVSPPMEQALANVREPAVADAFYPGDSAELEATGFGFPLRRQLGNALGGGLEFVGQLLAARRVAPGLG